MKKFITGGVIGCIIGALAGIIMYDKSLQDEIDDCRCDDKVKHDCCCKNNNYDYKIKSDYSVETYKTWEDELGIKPGTKIKHFKRDLGTYEPDDKTYIYIYDGIGTSTEDGDTKVCIYHEDKENGKTWVRPALEFFSKVDGEKYPEAKGKFRFTPYVEQ